MKGEPCADCGRPNTRGGQWCARCYQRRYRHDPVHGAERRQKDCARARAYAEAHPERRRQYVLNYKWHQIQGTVR